MIPLIQDIWNREIHRNRKQNTGYQGLEGEGNRELLFNGYSASIWDDKKFMEMDDGDGCTL